MAKQIGSQYRETLQESGMILIGKKEREAILFDPDNLTFELYVSNNHWAGAVIVIHGCGHEFVRDADIADLGRVCGIALGRLLALGLRERQKESKS